MRAFFLLIALLGLSVGLASSEEFLKFGEPPYLQQKTLSAGSLPDFALLAKELSPVVVNISAEGELEEGKGDETEGNPFPGPRREPGAPYRSLGSGFIVQADGYIVTNQHVIEKAERIIVRLLNDKSDYVAEVVGRDSKTDLALLKINPSEKLHVAYLGDSDRVEVGEWVVAIGNQFQLGHTVSAGIVSALARKVRSSMASPYEAYIQTDASINPGSSGGPLFNAKGEVIGVNTAIYSPGRSAYSGGGFNIGIGFAIPINLVKSIILQLKEHGKVTRGLLGVVIQQIDNDIAQILGLPTPDGALVADVIGGSPAEAVGFQRKDVIVSYAGKPVKDYDALPLMVANSRIGSQVDIGVLRNGKKMTLSVTIGELKETPSKAESQPRLPNAIGVVAREIDEEARIFYGRQSLSGVLVVAVEAGSRAGRSGIERGDVIEEISGKPVHDLASFETAVKELEPDKPALVLVRKREGTRFLVLKPKKTRNTGMPHKDN